MQKSQMFIIILQKYAHTFVYFDIFLYLCRRVRLLVAMVHFRINKNTENKIKIEKTFF